MPKQRHNAGALDIRAIIAYLVGIYGVVLLVAGIASFSDADSDKADGININLVAGVGMIVVAAVLLIWNYLNPTKVPDDELEKSAD